MATWKVRAHHNPMQDAFDVLIECGDATVLPFSLTIRDRSAPVIPTFSADETQEGEAFLRAVLNAAWDAGLRPDGYLDTRESMGATNAHLQDMRAIAFHKIGAIKP
ncbi:hypothetical protein EOA64_00380 [Mesorhizobium sp. M1A.F.Ca.IN.022.02.1.1]|uniref:hypothetical protein n=1 Tax=Mesorhizobium sp. M1A.F.Ca.IN.022.02.1.1 TaxID=2496766 RepID=UPI000FCAA8D2|nr:hypothetical protein [Mesorhizobium sp. M1A.F.Ca.IN.022.02.1.1]RUV65834.1 hypothetical protein EOA64_00380 [Mesorhizobium sp. M1A.F.Ca.IN.022.02.1.1]RWI33413.1 MAG: hypothetical protein EOR13_17820 [Mesorhizobium sp.]